VKKKTISDWWAEGGDDKFRFDYPLTEDSLVVDVGGYDGAWAQLVWDKFKCNIIILEPVERLYQQIVDKFKDNSKVKVYKVGAHNTNQEQLITFNANESSMFGAEGNKENIQLVDFVEFYKSNINRNIDLLKINIEGGEYELFEHLINNQMLSIADNFQVQFHSCYPIPNYSQRKDSISEALKQTHVLTYEFEYVWENWKRKS
jgi:FkbM family methyltransferase